MAACGSSLRAIAPYRCDGVWMFDDKRVGLEAEPFVNGADKFIEQMAIAANATPELGFVVVFSDEPFVGSQRMFYRTKLEDGGAWYRFDGAEGWLCPALMKYFDAPPLRIFVRAVGA